MKKIIFCLIMLFIFMPVVLASSNTGATVGGKYYDTLNEAISNAKNGEIIKLLSNAKLEEGIILEKNLEIDLNGNTIDAPTSVFEIRKGYLKLTGSGVIKETEPNYGAIRLIGNNIPNGEKYSSVYVGKDVTLEGWAGIFVSHNNGKSFGVNVDFAGKINAVDDINGGTGIGIYVNGTIKDNEYPPTINIKDGAVIDSTGDGIYMGGYSIYNIGKANISGLEAGIGMKAGILNINGATITSNGIDYTPTVGQSNGINASGTALQIESNSNYAGNMVINVKDGTFKSKNSYAIYEYIGKGSTTLVKSINIENGKFISNSSKDALVFSPSFNELHKGFISGGEYSSNPNTYLKAGYSTSLVDNVYKVDKSTIKTVFSNTSNSNKFNVFKIIGIFVVIIGGLVAYLNRNKILKLIKK